MSVRKQALKYTAAAIAVAALIIVSSTVYLNQIGVKTGQLGGSQAKLVIQLTDPPIVPKDTSSLNLTYSSIALLVGEPAAGGNLTIKTVTVASSATVDLLKLQNVSQTLALASLPNDSVIYSFTFTVTGISIDVNGTKSAVTLSSGSTLTVTLPKPTEITGTDIALLRLNPVVVSTPTGYEMIPSAVGIVRSEGQGEQNQEDVGSQHQLNLQDEDQLEGAGGNLTATLTALSVSGNTTTISFQVKNVGNSSVVLNGIGVHGNFTTVGHSCGSSGGDAPAMTESGDSGCGSGHPDEVVFVPLNSTVTGTSCVSLKLGLANGGNSGEGDHGLNLTKGQCVNFTFTGKISFGESNFVLIPSTLSGQAYAIHVIASEGANLELSCKLPVSSTSCTAVHSSEED